METALELNGAAKGYPKGIVDLENLLLFMKAHEIPQEEIVVEIRIDGQIFSEEFRHQAREFYLKDAVKVEIMTQTKESFAKHFMEQAPGYLLQLNHGFKSAARLLKDPLQEENGHETLARSLETLLDFKAHLDSVGMVLNGKEESTQAKEFWGGFKSVADKLIKSQEKNDITAIADLLEEDMLPFLDAWQLMMSEPYERACYA